MPDKLDAVPAALHLVCAKGANRISYLGASRISEAFAKDAAPTVGAICVVVQADYEYDYDDDIDVATGDAIVALAIVNGIGGVASGTVRATLTPVHRLPEAVPVSSLQGEPVELGDLPADYHSRKLDPEIAETLLNHLAGMDPSVSKWLAQVFGELRTFPTSVEQSRVEAKDAVKLAAQLAEIELPADAFVSPPAETENETLLQTLLNAGYEVDLEEELLPLDLQRFDGKLTGKQRAASVTEFTDKWDRTKLIVMSVNKKPIELELGVDLLYWDQIHDSFTFIQYKRLEKVPSPKPSSGSEWAYLRKGEIEKQLELMPSGKDSSATAADWRAFGTPFWFKFVRGDAGSKLDGKTLKGMHIPADWLRPAMKDETFMSGPRGGFRVTYDNAKYLGRTAFTQLISRGFVGTAGARSKAFKKVLRSKDRELIIAVRTEWQKDTTPAGTARAPRASNGLD
ncbi:hypothetical protein [Arthrobacter sp. StoSoilB20]|uniref:hypothetical protein n=1 Tax=Arthrobacter sp. StoSoilB20 TaxID=2830995 RepID=UPI001CC45D77|nr:hypothetical protein [Arthrobacter sp. StoSoilB20]BCW58508.1 hypothetical protein StoSoilB20_18550 [Arthrobacter sp. StoSoilB20]